MSLLFSTLFLCLPNQLEQYEENVSDFKLPLLPTLTRGSKKFHQGGRQLLGFMIGQHILMATNITSQCVNIFQSF